MKSEILMTNEQNISVFPNKMLSLESSISKRALARIGH